MHMLRKLHGKMFITRNTLHVFICIVILFVVQMQTNINVKCNPIHFVVRVNLCVDVNFYAATETNTELSIASFVCL
jgi:uncharacterized membrane-anchored protein